MPHCGAEVEQKAAMTLEYSDYGYLLEMGDKR